MASKTITTPIVETYTATTIELTKITIDSENTTVEAEYLLLDDQGRPYKRGRISKTGPNAVNALFQLIIDQNATTGAELVAALESVILDRIDVEI